MTVMPLMPLMPETPYRDLKFVVSEKFMMSLINVMFVISTMTYINGWNINDVHAGLVTDMS
jgi:hypothetical protein